MSIKLSKLSQQGQATVTVQYGNESLNVTYNTNAVTPAFLDTLKGPMEGEAIASAMSQILVRWDLLDDKAKPIKPTIEVIRKLPISFLMAVMNTITDSVQVPKPSGETSDAG